MIDKFHLSPEFNPIKQKMTDTQYTCTVSMLTM